MMLHSCWVAPFWVVVLLGAYPATSVRTVVKLKECGYKSLSKAKVTDLKDGRVQVKFCEETVVLDSNQSQTDAWKSLMWWDPAQQGKKLTEEDLKILKSYLGQYDYSRPMGQIGHGLLPTNYEGFREDNRGNAAGMVRAVLNFEVSLANTLNKLPATGAVELYRGGWTSAQQLHEMQAALDSGSAVSFPWFQSTTTLQSHAYKFMGRKSEPEHCQYTCVEQGEAFPTFLTYKTCHGKNVEEWNRLEQEWLLLPSLSYKPASISKVMNDPWWEATPKDMAEWLGQSHTVIEDWSRKGKTTFGPWPDLAAAVLAHSIDGRAFMKWNANRSFPEPYVKGKWDESEYLYSDKTQELRYASYTRFKLPTISTGMGKGPNTVPYYYTITLEDAEPC
ncbi:clpC [Symbiodinium sp. CCMP2592]|nr:clpC [Symbiodinium sp. CCMP2592]